MFPYHHHHDYFAFIFQILFLDSVPEIHMHEHVPEFIDGLFMTLGDKSHPIKKR